MFLHRIHLDPRCKEARRDLSDPYQLHSTLCRAFCDPDRKCPEGEILWRLELDADSTGCSRILVQSRGTGDWSRIGVRGWLASADPAIDLKERLNLDSFKAGHRFRFRLRSNPCVTRRGKRLGLLRLEDQEAWLERKAQQHGFSLAQLPFFDLLQTRKGRVNVRISQPQILRGKQHIGNKIRVYSVLYDGILTVTEPSIFKDALRTGIGHGKVMGLGLLSVVPIA